MPHPPLLPERTGQPAPPELLALRERLASALGASGAAHEQRRIGGTRAIAFAGAGKQAATLVHFHGGGFRQGQPEMTAGYAAALAQAARVTVLCPAYRLAPEQPFPAALNDGLNMLAALRDEGAGPLILAGDSAGGGLAASLALFCPERGIEVAGAVLHSPWLDLTVSNPSYETNAGTDTLFSRSSASEAARLYLQGHAADDPLASPLFGDLSRFPPAFISVGRGEVLHADAVTFAGRLKTAGRAAELCEVDGMDHVAVTRSPDLAGSQEVLARTVEFISRLR